MPNHATDDLYGSQPCHQVERDPSKPIPLDEHFGAVPESEHHDGETEALLCETCVLPMGDCVCRGQS